MDVCIARDSESGGSVAQAVCLSSVTCYLGGIIRDLVSERVRESWTDSQGLQTSFVERIVVIFFLQLSSVPNVYQFIYSILSSRY